MSRRINYDVRCIYRSQLKKFLKLGIGKKTENGVEVTQKLIDVTMKRIRELQNQTTYNINFKEVA